MTPLRILLTNNTLADRAGTETYVLDVARALSERGHAPMAYGGHLGAVADELRAAGIPVFGDLDAVDVEPDLIHGQHYVETVTALLRFPRTPALYVCHGAMPWQETPPRHPRVLRYVAVDEPCRERCLAEARAAPDRVHLVLNFVDLARFLPRPPLPERPRRALVFSNYATRATHLPAIEEACAREGIALDVRGTGIGSPCAQPHELLREYDLVFAKGRAALEALATGNAVVLCDARGSGPMVTSGKVESLRPLNFGFRTLTEPLAPDVLVRQIRRYDAIDAARVSARIRAIAGLEPAIDRLIDLYQEVVAEFAASLPFDPDTEARASARCLRELGDMMKAAQAALPAVANPPAQRQNETTGGIRSLLRDWFRRR